MRRQRTIYHNDARYCYLWLFEPPMDLEDAWVPVDNDRGPHYGATDIGRSTRLLSGYQ